MKNVMTKAWEIARKGAAQFGGSVKSYFAEALKIAWVEIKNVATTIEIALAEGSRNYKSWVAEITGTDVKYGFKRGFINAREDENIKGKFFTLEEGHIYDVNCTQKGRSYVTVKSGKIVELSQNEVKEMVA